MGDDSVVELLHSDGQTGVLADITRTTPFSLHVTEIQAAICHNNPTGCDHD